MTVVMSLLMTVVNSSLVFSASSLLPDIDYIRANGTGPMPIDSFPQVSIHGGGVEQVKMAYSGGGMRLSWISQHSEDAASNVKYGTSRDALTSNITGSTSSYSCTEKSCGGPYHSGFIHTAHLTPLTPEKTYFYQLDGGVEIGSFEMPPASVPGMEGGSYLFAVTGDLGQTKDSNNTVSHMMASNASMVIHAGDLS